MSSAAKRPRVPCLFVSPLQFGCVSKLGASLRLSPDRARACASRLAAVHAAARPRRADDTAGRVLPVSHVASSVAATGSETAEVGEDAGVAARGGELFQTDRPRRRLSQETRRKIADAMIGRPKSEAMRAKVSEKLKGRVPWNKGKKLSKETRMRMSEARFGRAPWNKGRVLSFAHRTAISDATQNRVCSEATRLRMRMARRRPGDSIVSGSLPSDLANGTYPLVGTDDIHIYVTLRRELRGWSDDFTARNGRRPSLADVRRIAHPGIIRKFEQYTAMRDRLRGLASDVYGTMNPDRVPVVNPCETASSPQNNNAGTVLRYTSNGHPRLVPKNRSRSEDASLRRFCVLSDTHTEHAEGLSSVGVTEDTEPSNGAKNEELVAPGGHWGQWDEYDLPSRGDYSSGFQVSESIAIPVQETKPTVEKEEFSVNDYRTIGKYRLMEAIDINTYVELRRDLTSWSAAFKKKHGRTPALSDVQSTGDTAIYRKFCRYIEARDRMDGLVREVCGAEITDLEKIEKLAKTGRALVDRLRPQSPSQVLGPSEDIG